MATHGPLAAPDAAEIIRHARHAKAAARRADREAKEWLAAPASRRVCLYPEEFIRLASTPLRCYRRGDRTVLVHFEWPRPAEEVRRVCYYVHENVEPVLREKGLLVPGDALVVIARKEGGFEVVRPTEFESAGLRALCAWVAEQTPGPTLCLFDPEAELRWGKHRRAWVAAAVGGR